METLNGTQAFFLDRFPVTHRAIGSLPLIRLLTKKQTEVIHCKRTKRTRRSKWICASM
jgi:hypothetical protein